MRVVDPRMGEELLGNRFRGLLRFGLDVIAVTMITLDLGLDLL
jgi:hypothetical protein